MITLQSRKSDNKPWAIRGKYKTENHEYIMSGKRQELIDRIRGDIRLWQECEPNTQFRMFEDWHPTEKRFVNQVIT